MWMSNTPLFWVILLLGLSCSQNSPDQASPLPTGELAAIIADAQNGGYGNIHSLLVYQNGELLAEEYFDGYDADSIHYQYSVTKSVASLLIGIAMDQGLITSLDQKVYDMFPEYNGSIANWDPRKADLTLEHVLTMSAGFRWDEWTYIYTDQRNDANKMIRSDDLMKFVLDQPMAFTPGSRFTYNSGCSMLLSGFIENSTGMTTEAFANQYLFSKLGITEWYWEQGRDGKFNTGWGLHLKPRDMMKLGQLVLNNGLWNGERVVSESWLQESSRNHINNYGYQWWLSADYFSARGWGGQVIAIVPEDNLVLVTTAGDFTGGAGPSGLRILSRLRN